MIVLIGFLVAEALVLFLMMSVEVTRTVEIAMNILLMAIAVGMAAWACRVERDKS